MQSGGFLITGKKYVCCEGEFICVFNLFYTFAHYHDQNLDTRCQIDYFASETCAFPQADVAAAAHISTTTLFAV